MIAFVLRMVATAMELALAAVAAILLEAGLIWMRARGAGRAPPPFLQPLFDLVKLWRKRRAIPEFSSPLAPIWAPLSASAMSLAAFVVPGAFFDTLTQPLATAPVVIGLLSLGRAALILAALDAGQGARGLSAALAARDLVVFVIALSLMGLVHSEITRSLTLVAPVRADTADVVAQVLGMAGLFLVLSLEEVAPAPDSSGPDRALWMVAAMLGRVAVILFAFDTLSCLDIANAKHVDSWLPGVTLFFVKMIVAFLLMTVAPILAPIKRWSRSVPAALALLALALFLPNLVEIPSKSWLFIMPVMIWGAIVAMRRRGCAVDSLSLAQAGVLVGALLAHARSGVIVLLAALVLGRLAIVLSARDSLVERLSLLALAGLPPFGLFAGDFLALHAASNLEPGVVAFSVIGLLLLAFLVISKTVTRIVEGSPSRWTVTAWVVVAALAALGVAPAMATAIPGTLIRWMT